MSGLSDISVKVESVAAFTEDTITGMADAVLREIHQYLEQLCSTGESHVIDLRSLPLTEADRRQLKDALGEGEVEITIKASGPTEIYETAYAGVWWIDYQDLLGSSAVQQIEIARVPGLVPSHEDDVALAMTRLDSALAMQGHDTAT